jgi:hypothetical protein
MSSAPAAVQLDLLTELADVVILDSRPLLLSALLCYLELLLLLVLLLALACKREGLC